MLRSIRYSHIESRYEIKYYVYNLEDGDFFCSVKTEWPSDAPTYSTFIAAIIQAYKARNLNISKNIAIAYFYANKHFIHLHKNIKSTLQKIERDKSDIDKYRPKLEYGLKYYKCVINQFKMLTYPDNYAKHNHLRLSWMY